MIQEALSRRCETCGSTGPTFSVVWTDESRHFFDSIQCALRTAPRCIACRCTIFNRPHYTTEGVFCSSRCLKHWTTVAAWLPHQGEGAIDPIGSTPPALGMFPIPIQPAG